MLCLRLNFFFQDKKSQESDSSAQEESDEGDFDGREVSYMTSGSESSGDEPEDEKVNKQLKGEKTFSRNLQELVYTFYSCHTAVV